VFSVQLGAFRRVMRGVVQVSLGGVRVMRGLFMVSGFVMLRGFAMMPCGVFVMLSCFVMMFGCLFGHTSSSELASGPSNA